MKRVEEIYGGKYRLSYDELEEQEYLRLVQEVLREDEYKSAFGDKVVIDIGANIGLFSLYALPFSRVIYAIEPSKSNYGYLEAMVADNKLGDTIKTFNIGLAGSTGVRKLGTPTMFAGYSMKEDERTKSYEDIETKTLAQFMGENGIEYADIIKVDVEGAEDEIFRAEDFKDVKGRVGLIIGESHSGSNIYKILEDNGFKVSSTNKGSGFIAKRI